MNDLGNGHLGKVDDKLGLGGGLVLQVDTSETLQRTIPGPLVHPTPVGLFTVLDRGRNVDLEVVARPGAGDQVTDGLSGLGQGSGRGSDDSGTSSREFGGDETDPSNVGVLVLGRDVITDRAQVLPDGLAQQQADASSTLLLQHYAQGLGDRVLARVVQPGQEDDEPLLETRRVGFTQNLDDGLVTEPVGDGGTGPETLSELGTGNVGRRGTLGHLVYGLVLVRPGEVCHHLEGNHFDVQLVLVLGDELLGIVGSVKVLALRVLAGTGVITTDDKVGGAKVLSDDGVPDGFPGSSHPHGEGQEGQSGHSVGVLGHQGLVGPDSGVVVDVTGLGETDDGVDQDVGLVLTSRTDGQLSVSPVHGVTGLESDDLAPRDLFEVSPEFGRGEPDVDIVKVLRRLNGLDFTTDVELFDVLPGVGDGRVSRVISTHDTLGL